MDTGSDTPTPPVQEAPPARSSSNAITKASINEPLAPSPIVEDTVVPAVRAKRSHIKQRRPGGTRTSNSWLMGVDAQEGSVVGLATDQDGQTSDR